MKRYLMFGVLGIMCGLSLQGMGNQQKIGGVLVFQPPLCNVEDLYLRGKFYFEELMDGQLSSLAVIIGDNPKRATEIITDLDGNNVAHMLMLAKMQPDNSFYKRFSSVLKNLKKCMWFYTGATLGQKNKSGKSPLNLFQELHKIKSESEALLSLKKWFEKHRLLSGNNGPSLAQWFAQQKVTHAQHFNSEFLVDSDSVK